jgi:hypothetical protein
VITNLVPRRYQTLADYVAIALAPLLIFWMLNSLANFLMMVLYHGNYSQRVTWTLFFYTMGATALARVTIEESRSYSSVYAVGLGAATFLVLTRFLGDPIFSLAVILTVGYLADRIVHDCTIVDDGVDSSGQGLVDSARKWIEKIRPNSRRAVTTATPAATSASGKSGHQPGRTVLYLALAALPLFGIGQFFLSGNPGTWDRARLLLTMYLFASLSLLVVTSFLNLRRYLRQRNTEMPTQVTVAWLLGGMAMILLILLIAFIAPLPGQAILSFEVPEFLASTEPTTASPYGWGGEGADQPGESDSGTGAPREGVQQPQGSPELSQTSQTGAPPGGDEGQRDDGPTGKDSGGKKPAEKSDDAPPSGSDKQQEGREKEGSEKNGSDKEKGEVMREEQTTSEKQTSPKKSDAKQSPENESPESQRKSDANQPESNQSDENNANEDQSGNEQESEQQPPAESKQPDQAEPKSSSETPASEVPSDQTPPTPESPPIDWAGMLSGMAGLLKFLLIAALLVIVAVYVYLYREAWLEWLRGWMAARDGTDADSPAVASSRTPVSSSRPFSSFVNPIGKADAGQVVVITFQALEAWGREQGCERANDETPNEYMRRLVTQFPPLKQSALRVVDAYNRVAYGRDVARREDVSAASSVWQIMRPQL